MYPYTQWFCWSLSLLNGYNWGYTPFSDIPIQEKNGPDCELVVLGVAVSTDADVVHLQNVITWLRGEKRIELSLPWKTKHDMLIFNENMQTKIHIYILETKEMEFATQFSGFLHESGV